MTYLTNGYSHIITCIVRVIIIPGISQQCKDTPELKIYSGPQLGPHLDSPEFGDNKKTFCQSQVCHVHIRILHLYVFLIWIPVGLGLASPCIQNAMGTRGRQRCLAPQETACSVMCRLSWQHCSSSTAVRGVTLSSYELQDLISRQTINDVRLRAREEHTQT